MTPTLAPKAPERAGIPPVGGAFLPIFRPLGALSLVSSCCGPCTTARRCTVDEGSLSQTSSAIMGARVARSAPVHPSPPMASLSWTIWGAGWAVALPCPSGSTLHRVCSHSRPSPYFITDFLILTLCLVGSNNQLGISDPRVAIEVPYGISDVLVDPVEEMIFEVLLDV